MPQGKKKKITNEQIFGKKHQIATGVHPGINADQLKPLKCQCGHDTFIGASEVRYASPLQATSGGPTLVQIAKGFLCAGCGQINKFDTAGIPALTPPTQTRQ